MPIAATASTCGEEDAEHHAARGADALHRGDHLAPLVDEGRHRVGDADAADQQRGEPDERQELPQPLERAAHLRRGIAPVGDGEARLGQLRFDALRAATSSSSSLAAHAAVELHGIAPAHQRARLDEPRLVERRLRDEDARAVGEPVGDAVRLRLERCRRSAPARCRADRDRRPSASAARAASDRRRRRAQRLLQRPAAGELHRADQRIGGIDALQLGQRLIRRRRRAAPWCAWSPSR